MKHLNTKNLTKLEDFVDNDDEQCLNEAWIDICCFIELVAVPLNNWWDGFFYRIDVMELSNFLGDLFNWFP